MSSTALVRFCPICEKAYAGGHKKCKSCSNNPELHCRCPTSGWTGLYTTWYKNHGRECAACNPKLAKQIKQKREYEAKLKRDHLLDTSNGQFHTHLCDWVLNDRNTNSCTCICCCVVCYLVPTIMQIWVKEEELLIFKTGLSRSEVDSIWRMVADSMVHHYEEQHHKRDPPLLPFASLLITLYWMRHYPTIRCLAAEFSVSTTHMQEVVEHCLLVLFAALVPDRNMELPVPHRGYKSEGLKGVRLVVDSTFLTLPQHSDAAERKRYYHPKSPTKQALKWQLCVSADGVPWHITDVVHGSKADVTLLRESGLLSRIPDDTKVLADKAYVGLPKVITPRKKPRGGELKAEEKKSNKVKHRKRAVIENCIHGFKKWAVLGGVYRGEFREARHMVKVSRIVHIIGAMVKRRLTTHPLRADPTATA
jgi:hypothetical protein